MLPVCLGCSSPSSSTPLPHYATVVDHLDEKPRAILPPLVFSCGCWVCDQCQRTGRRSLLRACWRCEPIFDSVATDLAEPEEAPGFVIGLEEDDEEDTLPGYGDVDFSKRVDAPPTADRGDTKADSSLHYLRPEETLHGISLKYNLDPRLLCQLNKLNHSTIALNPSLLHTRAFLILPPGTSTTSKPIFSPEEERYRLVIRRMMVAEKISSHAEAKTYVDAVYNARRTKVAEILANRARRGDPSTEDVVLRTGGELEEARECYGRDRDWEKDQVSKGKGKAVIGSKLKSTGKVESAVKGWSFM